MWPDGFPSPVTPPAAPIVDSALPSVGEVLQAAVDIVSAAVSEQPLVGVLFGIAALAWAVRAVRAVAHGVHPRDPVRTFSRQDRAAVLARAGHRCEHHRLVSGRCPEMGGLQADHVHPHSRSGWTAVENGQALCARHNRAKGARVPWNWQLNRLARRRAGYFPPGTETRVVRHRPRRASTPS
jgi:hypothetical protein